MQLWRCPGELIRRLGFLTLVCFAVLFLSAPVIAVVSVVISLVAAVLSIVLPFALLGLLVWLPLRGFSKGAGVAWKDLHVSGEVLQRIVTTTLRTGATATRKLLCFGNTLSSALHEKAAFLAAVLLEVLSGALVGALLGDIPGFPHEPNYMTIACCGAIGAMLGILVAISRGRYQLSVRSSQAGLTTDN